MGEAGPLGPFTSRVLSLWHQRHLAITDRITSTEVLEEILSELLSPHRATMAQCHEVMVAAQRHHGGILVGDVCCFGSFFSQSARHVLSSLAQTASRSPLCESPSRAQRMAAMHEVFLGGSCNPTTWREDVAIPILKEHGVTFYNPQVACWAPELIDLEQAAKSAAKVMLFVIDRETRGIASMIEAAFVAGSRKQLVVVVNPVNGKPIREIQGETLSDLESQELAQSRVYLRDLVEMSGMKVYTDLRKAVVRTAELAKSRDAPSGLFRENNCALISVTERCVHVWRIFDTYDSSSHGRLTAAEAKIAFRAATSGKPMPDDLKDRLLLHFGEKGVTLNQFSMFVTEAIMRTERHSGNSSPLIDALRNIIQGIYNWLRDKLAPFQTYTIPAVRNDLSKDIYIGGSTDAHAQIIPLLKKHGLTYNTPLKEPWNNHMSPCEMDAITRSRSILFVISSTERALSDMVLAGYLIGAGCNIVLCIQPISESMPLANGETLTAIALRDYNRGRAYLSDLANRHRRPVFDDVTEATMKAIRTANVAN